MVERRKQRGEERREKRRIFCVDVCIYDGWDEIEDGGVSYLDLE